jgi:preprotein translocase subunit SecY
MAIFALNIMPYISAFDHHPADDDGRRRRSKQLKKEGEQGRKTINQYTRYLTVFLAPDRPTASRSGWRAAAMWYPTRAFLPHLDARSR